jgi:hypothetical protein
LERARIFHVGGGRGVAVRVEFMREFPGGRGHWPAWALLARRSGYLRAAAIRVCRIAASLRDEREADAVGTAAACMFNVAQQCRDDARSCR